MGVFDLFGREPKTTQTRSIDDRFTFEQPTSKAEQTKGPVSVFSPSSYRDVEKIIDALKNNKTAIVHLSHLKDETSMRILDILAGAVYALDGGVYEMEKNIFMFSPTGIEVTQ